MTTGTVDQIFRHRVYASLLLCGLFLCWSVPVQAINEPTDHTLGSISELPPGEQYRQLSLLMLLANGADAELLDFLADGSVPEQEPIPNQSRALQQYPTPLARIADPDSMLLGAGQMMRFAHQHRVEIEQELARIKQSWPILVSMIDMNVVREDAIIIRSAVADGMQYQQGDQAVNPDVLPESSLLAYQGETIHQRNNMEYLLFQNELDSITDGALDELSYKLDAFQRMADDELNPDLMDERIDAAANMNEETRQRFREQAYIRASTLYLMLIPAMVTVVTD
ncbi:MAG: hypothetical protein SH820_03870 [Xanthomonadales bacterium]|nr:hypothetical protein [Xanthomonadales bacterium]